MDLSKVSMSERLAGVGGLVLVVGLFLNWYAVNGVSVNGVDLHASGISYSGWDAVSVGRWVFLITALFAIALAVAQSRDQTLNVPITPSVVLTSLGGLSVLWILFRLLSHPLSPLSLSAKYGIFVSLVGAAVLTLGGRQLMQEDGASFAEFREHTDRFTKPRA